MRDGYYSADNSIFGIPPLSFIPILLFLISLLNFDPILQTACAEEIDSGGTPPEGEMAQMRTPAEDVGDMEGAYADEISKEIPVTPDHVLTINIIGSGSGTVSGMETDCGTTCSGSYRQGTLIELIADPDKGSIFEGWAGGGCAGTATCTISMDDDKVVTARFTAANTVTTIADVNGSITPLGAESGSQGSNSEVKLNILTVEKGGSRTFVISPKPGYHISSLRVDGIPADVAGSYTFADITSDHAIAATFSPDPLRVAAGR